MLDMVKKKQTFQFLFSTTDLDFDPKRVEVRDSKTGKKLKVESTVKIVNRDKVKIFAVRMTEGQIEKLQRAAGKASLTPPDFGRQAIEKAIQEKEQDSKRLAKNKKRG